MLSLSHLTISQPFLFEAEHLVGGGVLLSRPRPLTISISHSPSFTATCYIVIPVRCFDDLMFFSTFCDFPALSFFTGARRTIRYAGGNLGGEGQERAARPLGKAPSAKVRNSAVLLSPIEPSHLFSLLLKNFLVLRGSTEQLPSFAQPLYDGERQLCGHGIREQRYSRSMP